jgi:hypothetical protein
MGEGEPFSGGASSERRSTAIAEWSVIISGVIIVTTFWLTLGHQSITDLRNWNDDVTRFGFTHINMASGSCLLVVILGLIFYAGFIEGCSPDELRFLLILLVCILLSISCWTVWDVLDVGEKVLVMFCVPGAFFLGVGAGDSYYCNRMEDDIEELLP